MNKLNKKDTILIGLTLFSMAYNNATIYGKKVMTFCYTVV